MNNEFAIKARVGAVSLAWLPVVCENGEIND